MGILNIQAYSNLDQGIVKTMGNVVRPVLKILFYFDGVFIVSHILSPYISAVIH